MNTIFNFHRSPRAQHIAIVSLRVALGIVFLWFGSLKVAGYDPVFSIIKAGFPLLATHTGTIVLGSFEVLIGLGLITNILPQLTALALGLHMLGTLSVFVMAPSLMFAPHFPILTLEGEFVFKNIVFVASGLVVLCFQDSYNK